MAGESEDPDHHGESEVEEAVNDYDDDIEILSFSHSPLSDSPSSCDSSGERPSKRLRATEERDRTDRISALPEPVITHILSFLPTLDSFRTRVLSRRWQYLWTGVPTVCFDFTDNRRSRNRRDRNRDLIDFFKFVDKALVLCDGSVKHFCVKSKYEVEEQFTSSADLWARFASRNGVEVFELDFKDSVCWSDDEIYLLPQFLFTNSMFRELRFSACLIEPKTTVTWNSLKKLSIGYVSLGDDLIQRILTGTPVLETLELHHFYCEDDGLNIVNSSVKKLILREGRPGGRLYSLEIWAPNVLSLEISGDFEKCQLVDVKSLVEATLFDLFLHPAEDDTDDDTDDDLEMSKAQGLFNSLAHVKTLKLGTWAIKGLTMLRTKHSSCPLMKCESLTIDTRLWKSHPLGIAILLRYFPLVQTLIFTTSPVCNGWGYYDSPLDGLEEELSESPIPFSGFESLKTIKFFGFRNDGEPGFELVEILLKNARVLQKMIIQMDARDGSPKEMFKAAQKLLSFQRSFPSVELLVCG